MSTPYGKPVRRSGFIGLGRRARALTLAGIIIALLGALAVAWLSKENPQAIAVVKSLVHEHGLAGVFVATIIAGSVVPFGSPIIVAYAAGFGLDVLALALTAATGYTLGTLTSYVPAWIFGERYVRRKIGEEAFKEYAESWNKYGYKLCVLFSLIPGFPVDLLALVCGSLHTKAKWFLPACWITLFVQFLVCAWLGRTVGSWILT